MSFTDALIIQDDNKAYVDDHMRSLVNSSDTIFVTPKYDDYVQPPKPDDYVQSPKYDDYVQPLTAPDMEAFDVSQFEMSNKEATNAIDAMGIDEGQFDMSPTKGLQQ